MTHETVPSDSGENSSLLVTEDERDDPGLNSINILENHIQDFETAEKILGPPRHFQGINSRYVKDHLEPELLEDVPSASATRIR